MYARVNMAPGGFNVFAILRSSLDRAGLFDEAIYPAFCEDVEWDIRISKLAVPFKIKTYDDVLGVHGAAHNIGYLSGITTNQKLGEDISYVLKRWPLNCNYVRRKWGCPSEMNKKDDWARDCRFSSPFNISDAPVWLWEHSKQQRYNDHHLKWLAERGVVDQHSEQALFDVPQSYGLWNGFTYKAHRACPLTGTLGRIDASTCM